MGSGYMGPSATGRRSMDAAIARRSLRELVESLAGHKDQPAVKTALDAWSDEAKKAR